MLLRSSLLVKSTIISISTFGSDCTPSSLAWRKAYRGKKVANSSFRPIEKITCFKSHADERDPTIQPNCTELSVDLGQLSAFYSTHNFRFIVD